MAIKPNDCIIPYGKMVKIHIRKPWNIEYTFTEPYIKNFFYHVTSIQRERSKNKWTEFNVIMNEELKRYNAYYKENDNHLKTYIKFKTHADLTFFVLKWS